MWKNGLMRAPHLIPAGWITKHAPCRIKSSPFICAKHTLARKLSNTFFFHCQNIPGEHERGGHTRTNSKLFDFFHASRRLSRGKSRPLTSLPQKCLTCPVVGGDIDVSFVELTLFPLSYLSYIFTHLILSLATATHFKWVKITHVCLIWDQIFANVDV